QQALPLQDPHARLCLPAGDRFHGAWPLTRRRRGDHRVDGHRVWKHRPMSEAAGATEIAQPASFTFTAENLAKARAIIAKYPPGRQASAVLALLDLAQRQH